MVYSIPTTNLPNELKANLKFLEMEEELTAAARFFAGLLVKHQSGERKLKRDEIELFEMHFKLQAFLKYKNHWYTGAPIRGSGFRCIRINGALDPILVKSFVAMGLNRQRFSTLLPSEVTVWVDPGEVCMRIGEGGSVCNILKTDSPRTSPPPTPVVSPVKQRTSPPPSVTPSPLKRHHSFNSTSSSSSSDSSVSPPPSPPSSNMFPVFQSPATSPVHMGFQQQNIAMLMLSSCKDVMRRHDMINPMERMFVAG